MDTQRLQVDFSFLILNLGLEVLGQSSAQVCCSAAVTPFVVVPRYDLDQLTFVSEDLGKVGSEDAAMRIIDDIARYDRVFGVAQYTLERAVSCCLHGCVDVRYGRFFLEVRGQVDHGTGSHRNSHRDPGKLALELRDHQSDSRSCTGGRWDDVQCCRPCAVSIGVRLILNLLIVGIRVNGGHQTALDTEGVVEDFGDRCQAVGGARCVRNALQVSGELVIVNTQNASQIRTILCGSTEDNSLATGAQVGIVTWLAILRSPGEKTGAFDDDVDVVFSPRHLRWILFGQRQDLLAVDDQVLIVVSDLSVVATVNRIVLEQSRKHLVIGQVIDGNNLELVGAGHQITESQSTDTSKTIDRNSNSHKNSPPLNLRDSK